MTNEELQAIRGMMREELTQVKQEVIHDVSTLLGTQITQARQGIMHDVATLLDTQVNTQFNLLSEGQEMILERRPNPEDMEAIEARLGAVEAVVKKHSKEIAALKKAL